MSFHKRSNETWFWKGRKNRIQRTRNFGKCEAGRRAAEAFDLEVKSRKLRGLEINLLKPGIYYDELCQFHFDAKVAEGKAGT